MRILSGNEACPEGICALSVMDESALLRNEQLDRRAGTPFLHLPLSLPFPPSMYQTLRPMLRRRSSGWNLGGLLVPFPPSPILALAEIARNHNRHIGT